MSADALGALGFDFKAVEDFNAAANLVTLHLYGSGNKHGMKFPEHLKKRCIFLQLRLSYKNKWTEH